MHCYYKNINPQTLALTKAVAEVQWNLTYFGLETKSFPSNFYSLALYFTAIISLEEYNSKIICFPASSPYQITPQNTHVSDPNLRVSSLQCKEYVKNHPTV